MPYINPNTLTDYIDNIFRAAGAPDDHARIVAEALVGANLAGHDSHGVIRTMQYLDGIASGDMDPAAKPTITREQGVVTAKNPSSKKALTAIQAAYNQWHAESGRPYAEISRILSCSTGEIYDGPMGAPEA